MLIYKSQLFLSQISLIQSIYVLSVLIGLLGHVSSQWPAHAVFITKRDMFRK